MTVVGVSSISFLSEVIVIVEFLRERSIERMRLHKVFIFLDKSDDIRLHPDILEGLWSEPLVSDESFFAAGTRFEFSVVLHEEEGDFFVDDGGSFEIGSSERVVDCVHEFDDFEIFLTQSSLFRYLAKGGLHGGFIIFYVSLGEDVFQIISGVAPGEHQDLDLSSSTTIHYATSTLLMEFCHRDMLNG